MAQVIRKMSFMKLRNIIVYAIWVVILTFIYSVLREDFSIITLLIGFGIAVSALVVCVVFFKQDFLLRYSMKVLPFIWYVANLIVIIIISSIKSFYWGLFLHTSSTLITYETSLKNDMLITFLANSITLTPGTITIDKTNNTLKFMRLCKTDCPSVLDDVKKLEKLLSRLEVGNK